MKEKEVKRAPSTMERESEYRKLALGFRFGIAEDGDGNYRWTVSQWKKLIANGTKPTRKDAEAAMQKALAEIVIAASRTSGDRGKLRYRLASLVQRRPYIASWVFDSLAHASNMPRSKITACARGEELDRWHRDTGAGKAPLPEHHLTKPADEVAGTMWDICKQLGLVGPKAWRYAADMLGRGFTDPDAESTEDVPREKAINDEPNPSDDDEENPMTKDSPV